MGLLDFLKKKEYSEEDLSILEELKGEHNLSPQNDDQIINDSPKNNDLSNNLEILPQQPQIPTQMDLQQNILTFTNNEENYNNSQINTNNPLLNPVNNLPNRNDISKLGTNNIINNLSNDEIKLILTKLELLESKIEKIESKLELIYNILNYR